MRDASCTAHPIDEMEPQDEEDAYRRASKHFLRVFERAIYFIKNHRDPARAAEVVAMAVGLSGAITDESQTALAKRFGVTRACISKEVSDQRLSYGLPPSFYQKSSTKPAREARIKSLDEDMAQRMAKTLA